MTIVAPSLCFVHPPFLLSHSHVLFAAARSRRVRTWCFTAIQNDWQQHPHPLTPLTKPSGLRLSPPFIRKKAPKTKSQKNIAASKKIPARGVKTGVRMSASKGQATRLFIFNLFNCPFKKIGKKKQEKRFVLIFFLPLHCPGLGLCFRILPSTFQNMRWRPVPWNMLWVKGWQNPFSTNNDPDSTAEYNSEGKRCGNFWRKKISYLCQQCTHQKTSKTAYKPIVVPVFFFLWSRNSTRVVSISDLETREKHDVVKTRKLPSEEPLTIFYSPSGKWIWTPFPGQGN